jgi:hypothetical protein
MSDDYRQPSIDAANRLRAAQLRQQQAAEAERKLREEQAKPKHGKGSDEPKYEPRHAKGKHKKGKK